jgi:hypothetical protein
MSTGLPTFSVQPGQIIPSFNQQILSLDIAPATLIDPVVSTPGQITCNASQGENWLAVCVQPFDEAYSGFLSFNNPGQKGFYVVPLLGADPVIVDTGFTTTTGAFLQVQDGGFEGNYPNLNYASPENPWVIFSFPGAPITVSPAIASVPCLKVKFPFSSVTLSVTFQSQQIAYAPGYLGLACFNL